MARIADQIRPATRGYTAVSRSEDRAEGTAAQPQHISHDTVSVPVVSMLSRVSS